MNKPLLSEKVKSLAKDPRFWIGVLAVVLVIVFFKKIKNSVVGIFSTYKPDKVGTVVGVKVNTSNLTKSPEAYQNIANILYENMQYTQFFDMDNFDKIWVEIKDLNPDELKAVYKAFGIRKNFNWGVEMLEGNLVEWFKKEISNHWYSNKWFGNGYDKLKQLFAPTGLW